MEAVRNVRDVTGQKAVGARHRFLPRARGRFRPKKCPSKLLNEAFYATLRCQIKKLLWSDPDAGSDWDSIEL